MWIIAFICVLPSIIDGKLGFGDQQEIGSKNDKLLESLNTFYFLLFTYHYAKTFFFQA